MRRQDISKERRRMRYCVGWKYLLATLLGFVLLGPPARADFVLRLEADGGTGSTNGNLNYQTVVGSNGVVSFIGRVGVFDINWTIGVSSNGGPLDGSDGGQIHLSDFSLNSSTAGLHTLRIIL